MSLWLWLYSRRALYIVRVCVCVSISLNETTWQQSHIWFQEQSERVSEMLRLIEFMTSKVSMVCCEPPAAAAAALFTSPWFVGGPVQQLGPRRLSEYPSVILHWIHHTIMIIIERGTDGYSNKSSVFQLVARVRAPRKSGCACATHFFYIWRFRPDIKYLGPIRVSLTSCNRVLIGFVLCAPADEALICLTWEEEN